MSYLPWKVIRERVYGRPECRIEDLKAITCTTDIQEGDGVEEVQRFWRVFETLDREQRCKYLRFTWGRRTLPVKVSDNQKILKHVLKFLDNEPKDSLPRSHTCFF